MWREEEPAQFGAILHGEPQTIAGVGGTCIIMRANGALTVGRAVQLGTAEFDVETDVTPTAGARLGIVVGGERTGMRAIFDAVAVAADQPAAADNEMVLVQVSGIAYALADVNDLAIGETLLLGTVEAGRVIDGTTAGSILGRALQASTALDQVVKILLEPR